jgi:hypothetical protein
MKDIPQERYLVDCNTNSLRFVMVVEEQPTYQILLAMPKLAPFDSEGRVAPTKWRQKFHGEVILVGDSAKPLHLPVSSDTAKPCNWLERDHGLETLILGRLPLKKGGVYDVQVIFSEAPPLGSSIWLSGMVREAISL